MAFNFSNRIKMTDEYDPSNRRERNNPMKTKKRGRSIDKSAIYERSFPRGRGEGVSVGDNGDEDVVLVDATPVREMSTSCSPSQLKPVEGDGNLLPPTEGRVVSIPIFKSTEGIKQPDTNSMSGRNPDLTGALTWAPRGPVGNNSNDPNPNDNPDGDSVLQEQVAVALPVPLIE